jgi:hypothetical protein
VIGFTKRIIICQQAGVLEPAGYGARGQQPQPWQRLLYFSLLCWSSGAHPWQYIGPSGMVVCLMVELHYKGAYTLNNSSSPKG